MFSTVQSIQSLHLEGLCRLQVKCDGTRWRTGREVKAKMSNAVGSQYPSHYLGTCSIQHYYRWCEHIASQQLTEQTPTGRFKCTRPFGSKDEICFLRVCHHISKAVYCLQMAWSWGEAVSTCALLSADSWFMCVGNFRPRSWRHDFLLRSEESRTLDAVTEATSHFKELPLPLADHYGISDLQIYHIPYLTNMSNIPVSLCVTLSEGESRGMDLVILIFGTCWQWVSSLTPQPL